MALGLRGRFTLWFGVAALIPIAAAALATREVISSRYRAEFSRALADAEDAAEREVRAVQADVMRKLGGFTNPANPIVWGTVMMDLRQGATLTPQHRTELRKLGSLWLTFLQLDVLEVVGADDTVLAAPHWPALVDNQDELPRRLGKERPGEPVVTWLKYERDGGVERALFVAAARPIGEGGVTLTVFVGQEIGADLVGRLQREGVVEARLSDAAGAVVAASEDDWARLERAPSHDFILNGPDGRPAAHLVVAVPDGDLQRTLRDVTLASLALGLIGVVGAVLLGFAISRRVTRDLDALVDGAHAVSRGDLGHKVRTRTRDEIGEVAEAFNSMTDELQTSKERLVQAERVAAWQQIAQAIAHEIKNPLTPIQMSVETVRKAWKARHPELDAIIEDSTRTVIDEVGRMKRIVGEFSRFARLPKPVRQPCDLGEIVSGAMTMYRGAVRVVSELDAGLPQVSADRDQMTQVVLNLLENARDAVESKGSDESVGRITVRTRGLAGTVALEIEDNGPGFDPAIREKLFTPYFTTKKTGTGLGLSIVHRIVTDHGGKVSAQSEPGMGARFVVELPAEDVVAAPQKS
jgi:signal transduction histidine kinase